MSRTFFPLTPTRMYNTSITGIFYNSSGKSESPVVSVKVNIGTKYTLCTSHILVLGKGKRMTKCLGKKEEKGKKGTNIGGIKSKSRSD